MSFKTKMDQKSPQPPTDSVASIMQAGTRRSLVLSAIGAIIGLGIAGYGLFTAKGTEVSGVPAEDIALVNSKPLLVVDYRALLQSLYGVAPEQATKEQKQKVLNGMIREELFVQRGLEVDEPSVDSDVRAALVNAVELQTTADALSKQPTDDELREYYNQHKSKYSSEGSVLLHDLVSAEGQNIKAAPDVVQALRTGMAVATAISRFGLKESGKINGEEFYFAARVHLGDALFAQAMKLESGRVSDPIVVDGVSHLLVMEKNNVPVALDFDKVRSEVFSAYQHDASIRIQAGEETFLRKRARIQIAPGYEQ